MFKTSNGAVLGLLEGFKPSANGDQCHNKYDCPLLELTRLITMPEVCEHGTSVHTAVCLLTREWTTCLRNFNVYCINVSVF